MEDVLKLLGVEVESVEATDQDHISVPEDPGFDALETVDGVTYDVEVEEGSYEIPEELLDAKVNPVYRSTAEYGTEPPEQTPNPVNPTP